MGFIHISNRLAVKHKQWLDTRGATYHKNLAPKNPEKHSLSNCYYDFYPYLEPFGNNQQLSDSAPPHSVVPAPPANALHEFPSLERETYECKSKREFPSGACFAPYGACIYSLQHKN